MLVHLWEIMFAVQIYMCMSKSCKWAYETLKLRVGPMMPHRVDPLPLHWMDSSRTFILCISFVQLRIQCLRINVVSHMVLPLWGNLSWETGMWMSAFFTYFFSLFFYLRWRVTWRIYIYIYFLIIQFIYNSQNTYKAAKRNEYPCNMSRRVGRNLYETVCRQMQTN